MNFNLISFCSTDCMAHFLDASYTLYLAAVKMYQWDPQLLCHYSHFNRLDILE